MFVLAPSAHAIPPLQLYCPDAMYDDNLDTWVITDTSFELWVVGNVGGLGVPIQSVYLASSAYGAGGDISLTPSFTEVSEPAHLQTEPNLNGMLNHDEYKNADQHRFWSLGNMTSTSDNIWDFNKDFDPLNPGAAQSTGTIIKIQVHVTGWDWVHFDAFDHYCADNGASYKTHYVFSPNSHDLTSNGGSGGSGGSGGAGGSGGGEAPEPGSIWLLGAGLLGTVLARRQGSKKA